MLRLEDVAGPHYYEYRLVTVEVRRANYTDYGSDLDNQNKQNKKLELIHVGKRAVYNKANLY